MKTIKSKQTWLWGMAGVVALVMALAACNFMAEPPDTKPATLTETGLTRHEYLAALKTQDNHKLSVDELQSVVNATLNTTSGGRSVAPQGKTITGVQKMPLNAQYFTSSGLGRSAAGEAETEPVEVFAFAVENPDGGDEGFVLASNDIRVGTILAVAEGSLEDGPEDFVEILQLGLQDYIATTILEYNRITEAEIEAALEKAAAEQTEEARGTGTDSGVPSYGNNVYVVSSNLSIVKSAMLLTKWGQGDLGAYSADKTAYNNYVKVQRNDDYLYTGCGPTAIAQIIAYHDYIVPHSSLPLPGAFFHSQRGLWHGSFSMLHIVRTVETITNTSSNSAKGHVAVLMWYIGHPQIGNATYHHVYDAVKNEHDSWTSLSTSNAQNVFIKLGYTIPNYAISPTVVTGSSNFTITYNTSLATIKNALNNNRPIYFVGDSKTKKIEEGKEVEKKVGHAWVIDGHGTMTWYSELYLLNGDREGRYITLSSDNLMVHCNLGWDGRADGWYIYGIFDTDKQLLLENGPLLSNGNFSLNTEMFIPQKPN